MYTSSPPLPEFGLADNVPDIEISDKVLSYKGNVMMAAIISLLIVILFVLILHIYAKYVWFRCRQPPQELEAHSFHYHHHFHSSTTDATHAASSSSSAKGLESSAISSIPMFVYNVAGKTDEVIEECAICLSVFEADELCRRLPGCSHAFHVECIDMWFHSHSTCPICRSCPVSSENKKDADHQVVGTASLPEARLEIRVDGDAEPSSSSAPPPSVGESAGRVMMSRNRSERKIHPAEALAFVI